MSFDFSCQDDAEHFMSLKGLVNKNQGFFKSAKQAQFLFNQYQSANIHTPSAAMQHFGVPVSEGQVLKTATAYTRWADYGSRSVVPVMFAFVLDKLGVVAFYKIRGTGNLRDGWAPDPSKTQETWSRPADAVCPFTLPTEAEIAAKKAEEPVSTWLGQPGDKLVIDAVLVRGRDMGMSRFGPMFLSVFRDCFGNIVNIWKDLGVEVGAPVKIAATVKSHDEYKGTKQTTMIRAKLA